MPLTEAVILAGGLGTRLSEETGLRPKPMVELNGKPILLYIMEYLSRYSITDFIICLGYKGQYIKDYFFSMMMTQGDIELDLGNSSVTRFSSPHHHWKIKLIETGEFNMTGSRLSQALPYIKNQEFLFTYGDGLTNQDISDLYRSHTQSNKLATMTVYQAPARFGIVSIDQNDNVSSFSEKPLDNSSWINAGYFLLSKQVSQYISNSSDCVWEDSPLKSLVSDGELNSYRHHGFWKPMDTLKDKRYLQNLISEDKAPWLK